MLYGANSDLFGRRWFLLAGNVSLLIGALLVATSTHTQSIKQVIAGIAFVGFGAANYQLAGENLHPTRYTQHFLTFSKPSLCQSCFRINGDISQSSLQISEFTSQSLLALWQQDLLFAMETHGFGDSVSDTFTNELGQRSLHFISDTTAIMAVVSFVLLFLFYYPPAHPRRIPFGQAMRELDYVGMFSFTAAAALILTGIVYAGIYPSKDPHVIGTLVPGFIFLVFFALWETFMPLKQPVTPTHLFTKHNGRALTAPFVMGFVVTMFYYGTNIIWPTMIGTLFTTPTSPLSLTNSLSLVQGLGITTGATILSFGGTPMARAGINWKWQSPRQLRS